MMLLIGRAACDRVTQGVWHMMKLLRRVAGLFAVMLAVSGLAPIWVHDAAWAKPADSVITVTSTADAGPGTLRAAVNTADGSSAETVIRFADNVRGQIILTSGPLSVTSRVKIVGPGRDVLLISANDASRVLVVSGAGNLTVSSIGLSHGMVAGRRADAPNEAGGPAYGGAILNSGVLTLDDVAISDSTAIGGEGRQGPGGAGYGGAIENDGTLSLSRCLLTGNRALGNGRHDRLISLAITGGSAAGGAIRSTGTLRVAQSEFDDNSAIGADGTEFPVPLGPLRWTDAGSARGGAITSSSPDMMIRITDSTFAGNIAMGGFAGVDVGGRVIAGKQGDAEGGAVYAAGPGLSVDSSTLTANQVKRDRGDGPPALVGAALDAAGHEGRITLNSDTIAGNAGAAAVHGSTLVTDSSIIQSCSGRVQTSGGFNIDFGTSCGLRESSDQSDTNPRLEGLARNGGPTRTMGLPPGSAAVNQGNSPFATDQRGLPRIVIFPGVPVARGGNGSDVGAFELQLDVPSRLVASPAAIDFGSHRVESLSSPREVKLHNDGSAPIRVTAVSLGGADVDDFLISSQNCAGQDIAAGGSCSIKIRFSPSETGRRNATLVVDAPAPHTEPVPPIPLTGTGMEAP